MFYIQILRFGKRKKKVFLFQIDRKNKKADKQVTKSEFSKIFDVTKGVIETENISFEKYFGVNYYFLHFISLFYSCRDHFLLVLMTFLPIRVEPFEDMVCASITKPLRKTNEFTVIEVVGNVHQG